MLLAEYTDDIVVSQNAYAIKSRKNSLWSLATKLLSAFDHSNSTTHYLFEDAPEISKNEIKNILALYKRGKSHFQQLLAQDVYKTEPKLRKKRKNQEDNSTQVQRSSSTLEQ
ncbi:14737_t:CDS:2, partial [Racocetra fulgida]